MDSQSDNRTFLNQFPNERKSYVANLFCYAVRRGASTPAAVVASVEADLHSTYARSERWPDTLERTRSVLDAISTHYYEAYAYAMWTLEWERLTPAEKERYRAGKSTQYVRAYMEAQPATDKQIAYVRALGYAGEVTSKAHASELIDQLRRRPEVSS